MPRRDDPIQQQLIAARRAQILDAAAAVFAEKGFSRATIRDVSSRAGIADGTIYNYFENKTALLLGLLDRLNESDRREQDFALAGNMSLTEFVESYVRHRIQHIGASDLSVLQVLISEMLVNRELRELYYAHIVEPTFALAEQHFAEWQARGAIGPGDAPITARLFAGLAFGLLMLRLLGDRYLETHWQDLPQALTAFALHGLLPHQGDDDATAPQTRPG